ncbi:MAG: oxidoreductase [Chromatiales bacterium]|nr:oxidoreductase [Chromatiales bacterium]
MALLWAQATAEGRIEVRSAGRTRRLYQDGVCHTQYHPGRAATGSVWDLMWLPALLLPADARRALMLGVGGGAVMRMWLRHTALDEIVGIERSAVHLELARRFFDLDDPRVTLHRADALAWLARAPAEPAFDLIVDDLFGARDRTPERTIFFDRPWFERLCAHLTPHGLLVVNFDTAAALRGARQRLGPALTKRFGAVLSLTHPVCENRVAVFGPATLTATAMREAVAARPELAAAAATGELRFNLRSLQP